MKTTFKLVLMVLVGMVLAVLFLPGSPYRFKLPVRYTPTLEEQIAAQQQQYENDFEKHICNQNYPVNIGTRFRFHGHVYVLTKCVLLHGLAMVNDNRLWFFEHGDVVSENSNKIEVSLLPNHVGEYAGVEYEWYGAQLDLYQQQTNVVAKP